METEKMEKCAHEFPLAAKIVNTTAESGSVQKSPKVLQLSQNSQIYNAENI